MKTRDNLGFLLCLGREIHLRLEKKGKKDQIGSFSEIEWQAKWIENFLDRS